jgi:hypothetical protein
LLKVNKNTKFALGNPNFKDFLEYMDVYIDKNPFIREILEDPAVNILIMRPRMFGKSIISWKMSNIVIC